MNSDAQMRARLYPLLRKGEKMIETLSETNSVVDIRKYAEWRSQSLVCLTDIFGSTHRYTKNFELSEEIGGNKSIHITTMYGLAALQGLGILRAALEDIKNGYLSTLKELATAEVFSDLLDQAEHLLKNGYFTPAASLAGAVLENGLRSLAKRKNVTVKAKDNLSTLNNKLAAKNVYTRLRQKQIAFWVDVRNIADHSEFDKVAENDVADLVRGIRNFLAEEL